MAVLAFVRETVARNAPNTKEGAMTEEELRREAAWQAIYGGMRAVQEQYDLRNSELLKAAETAVERLRSLSDASTASTPAHDRSDGLKFDPDFGPLEDGIERQR